MIVAVSCRKQCSVWLRAARHLQQPTLLLLLLCSLFSFFFFYPLLSTDVPVSFLLLVSGNILHKVCLPWCCTCSVSSDIMDVVIVPSRLSSDKMAAGGDSDSAGGDSSVSDSWSERFTKSHLPNNKKKKRQISASHMEDWRAFPWTVSPLFIYLS